MAGTVRRQLSVTGVERVGASRMGNPTWRVTFEDGTVANTETDSHVGYVASNFAPSSRRPMVPVEVWINGRGRIVQMLDDVDRQ